MRPGDGAAELQKKGAANKKKNGTEHPGDEPPLLRAPGKKIRRSGEPLSPIKATDVGRERPGTPKSAGERPGAPGDSSPKA